MSGFVVDDPVGLPERNLKCVGTPGTPLALVRSTLVSSRCCYHPCASPHECHLGWWHVADEQGLAIERRLCRTGRWQTVLLHGVLPLCLRRRVRHTVCHSPPCAPARARPNAASNCRCAALCSQTDALDAGSFGINMAQRQCCQVSQNDVKLAKVVDVSPLMQNRLASATFKLDFVQQKGRKKFQLDGAGMRKRRRFFSPAFHQISLSGLHRMCHS